MVEVKLGEAHELEVASAIMKDAAQWLIKNQMPLWQLDELEPPRLQGHLDCKELYLAKYNHEYAGTILILENDPSFWPEVEPNSSLFVHKLAVRRRFAARGVATRLLEFALEECKARGRSFLRLDFSAAHPRLRDYYEGHGFEFIDQVQVGRYLVNRMFKEV